MNITVNFIMISLTLSLYACGSSKIPEVKSMEVQPISIPADSKIVMNVGACLGTCPVYSLIIESPGKVNYIGKRFTSKIGLFEKKLSDSAYQKLMLEFEAAKLWEFDDVYPSTTVDLAEIEIIYSRNKESKSIKGTNKRPEAILLLEKRLVEIADSWDWTKVRDEKNEVAQEQSQIIIQTKEQIILTKWVRKYSQYRLMFKNRLDNNEWLVTWDLDKIVGVELLKILQEDPEILKAEFDSKNN